jgi:iron complex outermembrane receptor protein
MTKNRLMQSAAMLALVAAGFCASAAYAGGTTAPDNPEVEIVVVTATKGTAANLAPSKSSLDAFEPQSIMTRTYIEDSVPDVSDYTGIALISPSVSGGIDNNGPGLSEKDAVIRGFGDGQYNVRYDGIPFADTNDPSHHSTSYFPASTVGAMTIDRGPGEAGDLGQASLGGSMEMFSRTLTDDAYAQQKATYGSWDTRNFVTTLQSGTLDWLNGARATANFQELQSDGYLTYAHVKAYNQFAKFQIPLDSNWTITLMGTHNSGQVHTPDNDGITLAQAAAYGKNFSMSNDPNDPTYFGYNTVRKHTDFEYARLTGDISQGFTLDNTAYMYGYINHTYSANDTWRTGAEILADTYPGDAAGTKAGPSGNHDIRGYDKLNAYRVYGDIFRLAKDFAFGGITGQVRTGLWYEVSDTHRHRYDRDWTLGFIPDPEEKTPPKNLPPGDPVPDATIQFREQSTWTQYQPFIDIEIHPMEGLTVTPGFKYMSFTRKINAPVNSKTRFPEHDSTTYTARLPFLTANYKIASGWATYAQYAEGFLVPPLKAFYVPDSTQNELKPQTSTSYQLGTVYNVDNLNLDADVYYVRASNAFKKTASNIYVNDGTVRYKGVEAEGTYAFSDGPFDGLAIFANGSLNQALKLDPGQSGNNKQIGGVPKWTAAFGLIYKKHGVSVSLINKFMGDQWGDDGEPGFLKIGAYNITNLIVGYDFGMFKLQAGVHNLFDHQNITDINHNDDLALDNPNTLNSVYFLPERSYQLTLRVTLD